ncbi:hypothetical protein E2C01_013027 [Portunus trituberculatus]|uniref:Uncharacterized protein n=1 Tax=Portunus trituberculatus TaxID=210409 RepID=A0A5B7DG64_PORTR|nr:hypothetical protein [Portunus trituberculatus]
MLPRAGHALPPSFASVRLVRGNQAWCEEHTALAHPHLPGHSLHQLVPPAVFFRVFWTEGFSSPAAQQHV